MKIVLAGINHRTAPVELREKLAFRNDELPVAFAAVQARGAREALILSTCNRVELIAAVDDDAGPDEAAELLLCARNDVPDTVRAHLYAYEQSDAIRHLFRVASSLDSMIVGEPQILGQLKQAFALARENGSVGPTLDSVLTRAFTVAKRIRTETEIGQSAVSVSYAAVELAKQIFGSLQRKRVLVVGAGKMSESTARHLLRAGASHLVLTNRTHSRAQQLAEIFRGEVIPYAALSQSLADVDIVIASSSAPGYVLDFEAVRRAIEMRRNQPMFLIDIAVPRNIDPEVNRIEHAFLYDIDDLQSIATRNLRSRMEVAEQAENIVADEVLRLQAKLRERDVTPTIVSLQEQLEGIRREVLDRYRPSLRGLTPEQEEAIEAITRGIVNKVAHGPISEMRRHAATQTAGPDPREPELVNAVRRIFRLRDR
jgi:glutamyl-tRNA reductase